jgi:hypothetical protein
MEIVMRSEELQDVIRTALNMAAMGVFCVILFFLSITARKLYYRESWITNQGELLRNEASDYLFQHGESVSGNDIVEFILKYDNKYDYYITIKEKTYPITNDQYLIYLQNPGTVEFPTILWTQDYLVNKVMKDNIYNDFLVTIDKSQIRKIYKFEDS